MNALRISRPSSVRTGIAWRFGSEVESRPVAATVWLKVVCRRRVVLRDQRRQRPEVRVQELRQLTPLLDHRDDRVLVADRAEHLCVGRVAGLALASGGQAELLEQDPADLLRRAEHELLARELVRLRLELLDAIGEARRDLTHPVGVDLHARVLHRGEHAGQRQLDGAVEIGDATLLQPLEQRRDQPARRLRPPHERGRLLLGLGLRHELDSVLRGEIVELVRRRGRDRSGRRRAACRRGRRPATPSRRARPVAPRAVDRATGRRRSPRRRSRQRAGHRSRA